MERRRVCLDMCRSFDVNPFTTTTDGPAGLRHPPVEQAIACSSSGNSWMSGACGAGALRSATSHSSSPSSRSSGSLGGGGLGESRDRRVLERLRSRGKSWGSGASWALARVGGVGESVNFGKNRVLGGEWVEKRGTRPAAVKLLLLALLTPPQTLNPKPKP